MDMARPAFASEFGLGLPLIAPEDALDTALGLALRASFLKTPAKPEHPASSRDLCPGVAMSSSSFASAAKAKRTYDGAIEICRHAKERKAMRTRRPLPSSGGEADGDVGGDVVAGSELECKFSFDALPDELLANVLKWLSIRDLSSATQTCKRWHFNGMQDEVWNSRVAEGGRSINCVGKSCPKWTTVKIMTLTDRVIEKSRRRVWALNKTLIESFKNEINHCWESGNPAVMVGQGPELLDYLSCLDDLFEVGFNLLYEVFGMAFIDRTDYLANLLLADFAFQEEPAHCSSSSSKQQHQIPSAHVVKAGVHGAGGSKGKWAELSSQDHIDEGRKSNLGFEHAGVSLWREVVTLWKRYRSWLTMVTDCEDIWHLEDFGRSERKRSHSLFAPSTLYDLGVICFRSQIVLRYRLRGLLQAGSNWLKAQSSAGFASDEDVQLLRSVHHLLQDLDVEDDFVFTTTGYTKEKLRRCFNGLGNSNGETSCNKTIKCLFK